MGMGVDGGKGLAHGQKPWPRDPGPRGVGCRRAAGDCGRDGRLFLPAVAVLLPPPGRGPTPARTSMLTLTLLVASPTPHYTTSTKRPLDALTQP